MRRIAALSACAFAAVVGFAVASPAVAQQARAASLEPDAIGTLALSSDLRVRVRRGRDVELEVRATADDDWETIAARVALSGGAALQAWNGAAAIAEGAWVRVPVALLNEDFRALTLTSLFPEDHREGDAWIHVAHVGRIPTYDAGLWQVAEWFTGRGEAFAQLLGENALASPELRPRQRVRVPAALLHAAFRSAPRSTDGSLEFGSDDRGAFAIYRLRPGEALYSAVVVRYTGRTKAEDVVAIADQVCARSDVRDLRDIPVGFPVKIPIDLLEPEFLPLGDPRRIAAEAERQELQAALERDPRKAARSGLEGVVVILDPGHGGRDLGTMNHGIWEHDYVYDISCRLKQRLERETAATVYMTLEDEETGCVPSRGDKLVANRGGTIKTDPPFLAKENGEATIGVNLRWYLANSILRREVARGIDPDRVVFLSIHADARHPSLGGVMAYVPGAAYTAETQGFGSATYSRYAEVREKPFVKFSKQERLRSEALSLKFADRVIASFRSRDLPVQPYQPVRHRIIRGRSTFVPAVLRGNAVPTKVLVEVVNLSNKDDAALLSRATDRERLADALYGSIFGHFGPGG